MATASPTQQRQIYIDQLQPHVAEPILAVGFLSTAGAVKGMVGDLPGGERVDDDINRAGGAWAGFRDAVRDLLVTPVRV